MNKHINSISNIDDDMSLDDFIRLYDSRYTDILTTIMDFGKTHGFDTPYFGLTDDPHNGPDSLYIDSDHPDYPKGDYPFFKIGIQSFNCDDSDSEYDLRIDMLIHGEEQVCLIYRNGIEIYPDKISIKDNLNYYSTLIRNWVNNRVDPWD